MVANCRETTSSCRPAADHVIKILLSRGRFLAVSRPFPSRCPAVTRPPPARFPAAPGSLAPHRYHWSPVLPGAPEVTAIQAPSRFPAIETNR